MSNSLRHKRRSLKAVFVTLLLMCLVITAGAFYGARYGFQGSTNIEINLLFDNLSDQAKTNYQNSISGTLTESEKTWGHIGNPYVINNQQHVRNLYYLQKMGFFKNQFPALKPGYKGTYNRDSIPYFLICKKDGSATVVDCKGMTINPVGDDQSPFYGSIKGYGTGSTTVDGITIPGSGIHNLKIQADSSANIDVGFFSKIGCLGYNKSITAEEFPGVPSTLENIIFSNVQVVAAGHSGNHDALHTWLVDLFTGTDKTDAKESNHLGILAGHVEYANINKISVYYSNSNTAAIDLKGGGGNFVCTTGFFGLMDNMNPLPGTKPDHVLRNSGLKDSTVIDGSEGGGGLKPGIMPGYLRAQEIYDEFNGGATNIIVNMKSGDIALAQKVVENGGWFRPTVTNFYFSDGVFTFALSEQQSGSGDKDTIEDIWPDANPQPVRVMAVEMLPPGSLETGSQTPEIQVPQNEANGEEGTVPDSTTPPAQPDRETTVPLYLICQPQDMDLQIWTLDAQGEKQLWPSEAEKQTLLEAQQLAADQGLSLDAALAAMPAQAYSAQREYRLMPGTYYLAAQRQGYIPLEATTFQVYPADLSQQGIKPQKIRVTLEEQIPETTGETTAPTVPETTAPKVPETTTATVPETTEAVIPEETQPTLQETVPSKASAAILSNQDLLSLATDPTAAPAENGLGIAPFKVGAPKAPKAQKKVSFVPDGAAEFPAGTVIQVWPRNNSSNVQDVTQPFTILLTSNAKYSCSATCLGYNKVEKDFKTGNNTRDQAVKVPALTEAPKTVTFNCTPGDLTLTINGQTLTGPDYTVSLMGGSYSYTASKPGYETKTGTLNVPKVSGPITETVTLQVLPVKITFETDQDHQKMQVSVSKEGQIVTPEADGGYMLLPGVYSYTAVCPGFQPITKEFTVSANQPQAISVQGWQAVPTHKVTFTCRPAEAILTLKDGNGAAYPVTPETGITRTAQLPAGDYSWSASCQGFAEKKNQSFKVSGEMAVEAALTEQAKTVTFTCDPADLTLTVLDSTNVPMEDQGNHTYQLMSGTYTYRAEKEGYGPIEGSLKVEAVSGPVTQAVKLDLAPVRITFESAVQPVPEGLKVTVMRNGQPVAPVSDGSLSYDLVPGQYTYKVTCPGYKDIENNLSVTQGQAPMAVKLDLKENHTVFFDPDPPELAQKGLTLEIRSGSAQTWDSNPPIGVLNQPPYQQELEPGDYSFKAQCPGYQPTPARDFTVSKTNPPISVHMDPLPVHTVNFTADPPELLKAGLVLQICPGTQWSAEAVTVTLQQEPYHCRLQEGTYTYKATCPGYVDGTPVTISVPGTQAPVHLEPVPTYAVHFNPTPQNLTLQVQMGDQWVEGHDLKPVDGQTYQYKLPEGSYLYKAACPDYRDLGPVKFTVVNAQEPQNVDVTMIQVQTVKFVSSPDNALTQKGLHIRVQPGTAAQWSVTSERDLAPVEGSPLSYVLDHGQTYTYQASCYGFQDTAPAEFTVPVSPDTITVTLTEAAKQNVTFVCTPANLTLTVLDPHGAPCTADPADPKLYQLYPGSYTYTATPAPDAYLEELKGSFQVADQAMEVTVTLVGNDPDFPKHPGPIVKPPKVEDLPQSGYPDIVLSQQWEIDQLQDTNAQYRMFLQEIDYAAGIELNPNEKYFLSYSPSDSEGKSVNFASLWVETTDTAPKEGNLTLADPANLASKKVSADCSQITLTFNKAADMRDAYYKYGITFTHPNPNGKPDTQQVSMSQSYVVKGTPNDVQKTTYLTTIRDTGKHSLYLENNSKDSLWQIKMHHSLKTGKDHWAFYRFKESFLGFIYNDFYLSSTGSNLQRSGSLDDTCTFRLYRVVKFDSTSDKIGYRPADSETNKTLRKKANEYVLKAVQNLDGTFQPKTYELVSFGTLQWRMRNAAFGGEGNGGSQSDKVNEYIPTKYFNIRKACSWGLGLNLGSWHPATSNIIRVPIGGKDQAQNFIPTGSMAFRVNKLKPEADGRMSVKIMVKVPVADLAAVETGNRLGIWKGARQSNSLITFDKDNPTSQNALVPLSKPRIDPKTVDKTKFPISVPDPAANSDFIKIIYKDENIKDNGGVDESGEYYTTLQGETVLLAADFDLTKVNNVNWNDPNGNIFIVAESDAPLQLVYCSSDGIASTTRDGSNGSALGTIDFVYDTSVNGSGAKTVVPVTKDPAKNDGTTETPENVTNFQNHYFPSNLLLHFNTLPKGQAVRQIYEETIYCYRSITQAGIDERIDFTVTRGKGWSNDDVQIIDSLGKSDNVIKKP